MSLVISAPTPVTIPVEGGAPGDRFPVARVYCVGRNYVEHAIEMGFTGREPPFFFLKPADAVLVVPSGETGRMHYPSRTSNLHHEVELVVAIGRGGRDIPAARAMEHVWGYGVGLDMTRRDLQNQMKKEGRPWCIGKAFDESAPIAPLVSASQYTPTADTAIELAVNGQVRQRSTIGKLIWSLPEIIEHLSAAWTLQPGDLIYTGTPEGVGAVVAGDRIDCRIDGLPSLALQIV